MQVLDWSSLHHKGFVMAGIFTRKLKVEFLDPVIHSFIVLVKLLERYFSVL